MKMEAEASFSLLSLIGRDKGQGRSATEDHMQADNVWGMGKLGLGGEKLRKE
jgi:hypothetical protein